MTNLLVALTTAGVLAALAMQSLPSFQEAEKTLKCHNNLRQLALGFQNHHDQRGDQPPMGMFSKGVSWAGLIQPYMENVNLWLRLRTDMPYDVAPNNDVRHLKGPSAAFPYFYCTARRPPPQYTDGFSVSDYAVPSVGADPALDDPDKADTWMQCHSPEKNFGPLLLVYQHQPEEWKKGDSLPESRRYRSKTSFSSYVDGTVYQILLGEKALHPDSLGKAGKAGDFTVYSFIENSFDASGAARPGNGGISPSRDANKETVYRYWGSWHPDICLFATADGGVKRINAMGSAKVVAALCNRRDGATVNLPDDYRTPFDDGALVENEE